MCLQIDADRTDQRFTVDVIVIEHAFYVWWNSRRLKTSPGLQPLSYERNVPVTTLHATRGAIHVLKHGFYQILFPCMVKFVQHCNTL